MTFENKRLEPHQCTHFQTYRISDLKDFSHLGISALSGHLLVQNVRGLVGVGVANTLAQRTQAAPLLAADVREHLHVPIA